MLWTVPLKSGSPKNSLGAKNINGFSGFGSPKKEAGYMAYTTNKPIKIPNVRGKISFRKKADSVYVQYEIGRTYNATRKNTSPKRVVIGLQIRNAPTLMLPNENYEKYFGKDGEEKMTAKERTAAENYEATSNDFWMLDCMFEQLYFEFQIQAHRNPHFVVNAYKIQRINKILVPLKRLMGDKPYGAFLEIPEEPREVAEDEMMVTMGEDMEEETVRARKTKLVGLDYSDVALLLTQYKGAMTRFAGDCL